MEHYFISKEHNTADYFQFSWNFLGEEFTFKSCDDVFSKNNVDYGTYVLLKTIVEKVEICGNVLDIGCGYGPIGIVLARFFKDAKFVLTDINQTAVELSKENQKLNFAKNIKDIKLSNGYENVDEMFDFIISNPPIKAGKKVLFDIVLGAHEKLNQNGQLIFVIKKKFGEESLKKQLEKIFKSVNVLKRDSGYYILQAIK